MPASIDDVIRFARRAHAGQTDKAGEPYIEHPLRVMGRLPEDDLHARMVAVLHDVLEDTAATADDLRDLGVPETVVEAVLALTHRPDEAQGAYWERVAGHPIARAVKLADIADNSDEHRLAMLPQAVADRLRQKYELARTALTPRT